MIRQYEKLTHQGELPRLSVVEQGRIRFHEEVEPARVSRVASRLADDGRLRHPPIVGSLGGKEHGLLLIDGAHRISGLRQLGYPYAVVQIVDYSDPLIELATWHHLLRLTDFGRFVRFLETLPGLQLTRRPAAKSTNPVRRLPGQIFQVITPDRASIHGWVPPKTSLARQAELLRRLVGYYKQDGLLDRISYNEFDWLKVNYPDFSALLMFRSFSKEDVRSLVRQKLCLPAGITRHLITKRVLRLNLPLDLLRDDASLEQRNLSLAALIVERVRQGRIRFYSESTFSFDE